MCIKLCWSAFVALQAQWIRLYFIECQLTCCGCLTDVYGQLSRTLEHFKSDWLTLRMSSEILPNELSFRTGDNTQYPVYEDKCLITLSLTHFQGDIFSGLNDGILSRAEALADIGKHQSSHAQMTSQLKHDVMYHHSMGGPPQRPLQVRQTIIIACIRTIECQIYI